MAPGTALISIMSRLQTTLKLSYGNQHWSRQMLLQQLWRQHVSSFLWTKLSRMLKAKNRKQVCLAVVEVHLEWEWDAVVACRDVSTCSSIKVHSSESPAMQLCLCFLEYFFPF